MASVFSLTALLATTVFSNIQTTQRGILSRQRVVADGRYVLEAMTRTAKLGLPDYAYYGGGNCQNRHVGAATAPCNLIQPQSVLAVRDQTNVQSCYRWDSTNLRLETHSSNCAAPDIEWSNITPADLQIQDFRVYIRPVGDPFRAPPADIAGCPLVGGMFDQATGTCRCDSDAANECWAGQSCLSLADLTRTCSLLADEPCLCKNPDTQPTVTVYLKTRAIGDLTPVTSTLQTTVNSRVYRR